jgi:hypothetical protein
MANNLPEGPATRPGSNLIMEVVIPSRSSSLSSKVSSVEESDATRPRRASAQKSIIFSDDSDASGVEAKRTHSRRKRANSSQASSDDDYDFEGSDSEQSSAGAESLSSEDEVDTKPKRKKIKASSRSTKSISGSSSASSDAESMDVDNLKNSKGKRGTKRKAPQDDETSPAKKKKRLNNDPWKLGSPAVRKEYFNMQAPPLEMFHFARVVVDEYTYLDGKALAMVTRLSADRHWVLSGTPPTHDFAALKTISQFLNIHLGVDDDGEGNSIEIKKRRKEQTGIL